MRYGRRICGFERRERRKKKKKNRGSKVISTSDRKCKGLCLVSNMRCDEVKSLLWEVMETSDFLSNKYPGQMDEHLDQTAKLVTSSDRQLMRETRSVLCCVFIHEMSSRLLKSSIARRTRMRLRGSRVVFLSSTEGEIAENWSSCLMLDPARGPGDVLVFSNLQ